MIVPIEGSLKILSTHHQIVRTIKLWYITESLKVLVSKSLTLNNSNETLHHNLLAFHFYFQLQILCFHCPEIEFVRSLIVGFDLMYRVEVEGKCDVMSRIEHTLQSDYAQTMHNTIPGFFGILFGATLHTIVSMWNLSDPRSEVQFRDGELKKSCCKICEGGECDQKNNCIRK